MMLRNAVLVFGLGLAAAQPASALSIEAPRADPCVSAPDRPVCETAIHLAATRKPIDKSCLMVCEKWNGDTCEKFVMKCKGDPGYPTPSRVKQYNSAPLLLSPQVQPPSNSP